MRQIWSLVFILSCLPIFAETQFSNERDNILVIHSYHQGLLWTDEISDGISSVLRDENVDIHYEYLDTKRNSGELFYEQLVTFEAQKKSLSNIDFKLIICSDNNALRFIMDYGDILYPGIPVIFCGINNFTSDMIKNRSDVTGVVESIDYEKTLSLIEKLHPDRKNIIVIVDRTETGELIKEEVLQIIDNGWDDYTFEFYQDFVLADVSDKISTLSDNDVIFLLTFNRDIQGNFISYYDGIRMIYNASDVPIYGAWDFYFENGIVGGMLTTGRSQGIAAAGLAIEILNGVPVSELEIITESPNELMFDYLELKRFGIKEEQLPPNSLIINRPVSRFHNSKIFIFLILIIFIITIILGVRLIQKNQLEKRLKLMNLELEKRVKEKTADLTEKVLLIEEKNKDLEMALTQIRTLKGILPICSHCKNIRNDQGYWKRVEQYISETTDAVFSHGLCPECTRELYPDIADQVIGKDEGQ